MPRSYRRPLCLGLVIFALAGRAAEPGLDKNTLQMVRSVQSDAATAVAESYFPTDRIDAAFRQKMAETDQALAQAKSPNDACLLIAEAFGTLDPGIRLYVFPRTVNMDYGWSWRLVGDAALVTQLDTDGDAAAQGLKLGDQIVSMGGLRLGRATHRLAHYALQVLAPHDRLTIVAQSPGEPSRELTITATGRPARKTQSTHRSGADTAPKLELSSRDAQRLAEYLDVDRQVRVIGDVLVWRAGHLNREIGDVHKVLARIREAGKLIIDLRGQYVFRHATVLDVLSELFEQKVEVGRIERNDKNETLRTAGGGRFRGMVLVLVDSTTAGFAELLARVVQQQQRGVIIGDRTMGQVQEEAMAVYHRSYHPEYTREINVPVDNGNGTTSFKTIRETVPAKSEADTWIARLADLPYDPSVPVYGVRVPIGRVVLADGSPLHGTGVAPDYQLLPKPEDIAAKRDVVLAKALGMLKQPVSPEDAYGLFRNDWDDDEFILDQSNLY